MIEISLLILSAGREEMNIKIGLRGLSGGSVSDDAGWALAKQTFLPPDSAKYAPQSAYWPSKVGFALPTTASVCPAPGAGRL
jgi:hypothetical protein